ncbi:MAG: AmmeMemoRadiSam system protein B [Deltaproteobacteria bacterium]|nr:AmmeMemoRadiSam system protein B [Deltaproteobacteria bacterium]
MFRRSMAFGGSWYPADRNACERQIQEFWRQGNPAGPATGSPLRLGIVPHAGWLFSGALAARVFRCLTPEPPDLVVVLGGHLRPGDPVVAMVEGAWETPFGEFRLHRAFREELEGLPSLLLEDERQYFPDNSVELQLPFAKYQYPQAELLTLRVPPSRLALEVGRRLEAYLNRTGLKAVLVASTDLTHYGPNYHFEPQGRGLPGLRWVREENDPAFLAAVAGGDGEAILTMARERSNACSPGAVAALNTVAQARNQGFHSLGYTTSHDVMSGDKENFVGYMGGVFA